MNNADLRGTILIVEDDHNTAALVATYLEQEGFTTAIAYDGKRGLEMADEFNPVFVILDVMLPVLDGWEVCRRLRRSSEIPILMLTAREEEVDRVMGLSIGADDYVIKPFSPRELVERVKAILRRSRSASPQTDAVLSQCGVVLDPVRRRVLRDGQPVALTSAEYKLLNALIRSPGKVFTRDELLSEFYEHGGAVIDKVIDVHVGKLRQKLEDDPANPRRILTVRGFGYRFADENEEKCQE
jgi:DNA-binding response OmpR family regulator